MFTPRTYMRDIFYKVASSELSEAEVDQLRRYMQEEHKRKKHNRSPFLRTLAGVGVGMPLGWFIGGLGGAVKGAIESPETAVSPGGAAREQAGYGSLAGSLIGGTLGGTLGFASTLWPSKDDSTETTFED